MRPARVERDTPARWLIAARHLARLPAATAGSRVILARPASPRNSAIPSAAVCRVKGLPSNAITHATGRTQNPAAARWGVPAHKVTMIFQPALISAADPRKSHLQDTARARKNTVPSRMSSAAVYVTMVPA
jgi:hypothetical protein